MVNFLTKFDGRGLPPRQVQVQALEWLSANWDADVLALNLPTGTGKSAIARAIQLTTGADIIPPTNQLMDQYTKTYPGVNALKGQHNYVCNETKISCGDSNDILKRNSPNRTGKPGVGFCHDCPYSCARNSASANPTLFNLYSLFYYNLTQGAKEGVLVVDEAHNLIEVIQGMAGKLFNSRKYPIPRRLADLDIDQWLQQQIDTLQAKLSDTTEIKKRVALSREVESIYLTREGYIENPENYAVELKTNTNRTFSLSICPIYPPRKLADRLLKASKLILLSATLLPSDVKAIVGHSNFKYLSLPSPIKREHRLLKYVPASVPVNSRTEPKVIAAGINAVVKRHQGENILIHLTYGMAEKVAPHLDFKFLRNTPETKDDVIARFKAEGGIFLASGCNEGLDLPNAECRVNIIPMLFRLNPTDSVVRKRLGLPGGRDWYNEQTLKALIQQAGRSTRGADDYSVTYVLDPGLPRLISDRQLAVPDYFKGAIQWHQ